MDEEPEKTKAIFALEQEIVALQSRLADIRAETVRGERVVDYALTDWDDRTVPLSTVFDGKDQLVLIHNMGMRCSYCTMWADGFVGILPYIERMAAFVIVSPDDAETQKTYSAERGWTFRMLSTKGTSLFDDMGFEASDGSLWPGVSTLYKGEDGELYRHSLASFGPGDKFCPVFSFAELLPFSQDPGLS